MRIAWHLHDVSHCPRLASCIYVSLTGSIACRTCYSLCCGCIAAFNYPVFVDEIKSWFYDAFGDAPRGDESLNEYQLKVFIGRLLREAYRSGLMPKAAFFSDGSMQDHEIEAIIERR